MEKWANLPIYEEMIYEEIMKSLDNCQKCSHRNTARFITNMVPMRKVFLPEHPCICLLLGTFNMFHQEHS